MSRRRVEDDWIPKTKLGELVKAGEEGMITLNKIFENNLVVKMCPENLFELTSKNSLRLKEDYWKTCTLCQSCGKNTENKIKVRAKENSYIFSIESDGVLPFNIIIKKTIEIFNDKIDEFITKLEELEMES